MSETTPDFRTPQSELKLEDNKDGNKDVEYLENGEHICLLMFVR